MEETSQIVVLDSVKEGDKGDCETARVARYHPKVLESLGYKVIPPQADEAA